MAKKRILVVDDEKDFVKMLKFRLEANGYEVIPAFDGNQGLRLAQKEKPDLIILDIMMPGGDGHLVCERLKMSSFTWSIPIIFLTARSRPGDEAKAYELGAKYFLKKPYEPEVLLETVKRALKPSEELKSGEKWRRRVLVIEGERIVGETVKHKLNELGYECVVAFDIKEGLSKAKAERVDLILLDGMLAKADNYEGFYQLKMYALNKIPIIISTTKAELEKFQKKLVGLAGYCLKPFDYTDLLDRIGVALKKT